MLSREEPQFTRYQWKKPDKERFFGERVVGATSCLHAGSTITVENWWPRHEILGMPEGRKALNHPLVGCLILEHTTFQVSNAPNLQLVLQLPIEEETEQKLQRLLASGCPHHCSISVGKDTIVSGHLWGKILEQKCAMIDFRTNPGPTS